MVGRMQGASGPFVELLHWSRPAVNPRWRSRRLRLRSSAAARGFPIPIDVLNDGSCILVTMERINASEFKVRYLAPILRIGGDDAPSRAVPWRSLDVIRSLGLHPLPPSQPAYCAAPAAGATLANMRFWLIAWFTTIAPLVATAGSSPKLPSGPHLPGHSARWKSARVRRCRFVRCCRSPARRPWARRCATVSSWRCGTTATSTAMRSSSEIRWTAGARRTGDARARSRSSPIGG